MLSSREFNNIESHPVESQVNSQLEESSARLNQEFN